MAFGKGEPHPAKVLEEALAGTPRAASSSSPADGQVRRRAVVRRRRGFAALTTHALGDASRDLNLERLRAKKHPRAGRLARRDAPMMAKRRVVSVTDVDRWRSADQEETRRVSQATSEGALLSAHKITAHRLRQGARGAEGKGALEAPADLRFRKLESSR